MVSYLARGAVVAIIPLCLLAWQRSDSAQTHYAQSQSLVAQGNLAGAASEAERAASLSPGLDCLSAQRGRHRGCSRTSRASMRVSPTRRASIAPSSISIALRRSMIAAPSRTRTSRRLSGWLATKTRPWRRRTRLLSLLRTTRSSRCSKTLASPFRQATCSSGRGRTKPRFRLTPKQSALTPPWQRLLTGRHRQSARSSGNRRSTSPTFRLVLSGAPSPCTVRATLSCRT